MAGKITRKADEDNGQSSCISHCKRYNHTLCYDNDTRVVFHLYDVSLVYFSCDYWCRRIFVLHYSGIHRGRSKMNTDEQSLFRDKQIGFLIYLGVESIMFLTLFATYFIFTPSSEGPHPSEIFSVTTVVLSSIFLLSSSGTLIVAEKGLANK